jgi:SAM-dependent methyltransferase
MTADPADHVRRNRMHWDRISPEYAERAPQAWASREETWGIWGLPERDLRALPEVADKDVVELGCGTGYWSAWLTRRGARVVGLDNSWRQLQTAQALRREHGLAISFIHADAEQAPLRDASFDVALSEYGASLWCDPYRWIPEAARLLRPGGELVFLRQSVFLALCAPDGDGAAEDRLVRDYFGLHRLAWSDDDSIEFALPFGEWLRLFRATGFEVLDLIELRPPVGATSRYPHVTGAWARRWPSEEIWRLRRKP